MPNYELEWAALGAVLPLLPHEPDSVERVDGQATGPDLDGLTFDFCIRAGGGALLAVEITCAWPTEWLRDAAALDRGIKDIERALRESAPQVQGAFVVSGNPTDLGKLGRARLSAIRDAVLRAGRTGDEVSLCGGRLHVRREADGEPLRIYTARLDGAWELSPESCERLVDAVKGNTGKLHRAGERGFETHLIVVDWLVGSIAAWPDVVQSLGFDHPQYVWAVDVHRLTRPVLLTSPDCSL